MGDWKEVCTEDELAPGDFRTVWLDDIEVAVINSNGKIHAIENICTHDGGELTGGSIEGCEIECPRHGARFDIRTGEALTPPAYEPVRTYRVKIEAAHVYVSAED